MRLAVAVLAGALFGAGLTVSGMTDTRKVQGWLDLFGVWDPTLAFVLGGAILPMLVAWRIAARMGAPVLALSFPKRPGQHLDRNLIVGSAFFGVGWALVGLYPGPAMAILGHAGWPAYVFFLAMIAGMGLARLPGRPVPITASEPGGAR